MKIALACNEFPPEFSGGTERVVLALARALLDRGEDVTVISGTQRHHEGRDTIEENGLGVDVVRIPRLRDETYGLELVRPRVVDVFKCVLEERQIAVLHLHHWSHLSVAMLRAAASLGIGGVATLHDMWTSCGRFFRRPPEGITCPERDGREACGPCAARSLDVPLWGLRKGIADRDREIRAELEVARAVTSPSRAGAALIARHVPFEGPIEVVPHGLLEPLHRPPNPVERDASEPLRIGSFGHLVREKGIMVLVEAMAGLGHAELHLSGTFLAATFEQEVVAAARARGVRLFLHGPFEADGQHPARNLDLAVFPSLCLETYGLVVEEALARGVPVVVSDLGALPERIGEGGIATPAGDVEALGRVLRELVEDPARLRRLGSGIPKSFATIQQAADRYQELYRRAREAFA